MSLPWKKLKSTKISRFVNDHLHNSQKRRDGSSLVVETGFPTSLIDLFMKNREKLKKKRRARALAIPPIDVNDMVISRSLAPSTAPSRVITYSPVPSSSPLPSEAINENLAAQECDAIDEIVAKKASDVVLDKTERRHCEANGVLLAILKMVLVLILAWLTKRLTLGITLSALLFFLDYLGKHVDVLFKPCSEAKGVLKIFILRFKEDKLDHKKGSIIMPEMKQEEFSNQEIQPVEIECDLVTKPEKIRCENEINEESRFEERLEFGETKLKDLLRENDEFICGGVESGRRKSKKDKIKSKVKKCFVKKLRNCKKERNGIFIEDHISLSEELESDQCKKEEESESLTRLSADSAFGGFSETSNEVAMKMENGIKEQESLQIWSCVVLGLIVLVGLIRGRSFALILTLSWFLLFKLGETLQKHLKLLKIKSLNDKSS